MSRVSIYVVKGASVLLLLSLLISCGKDDGEFGHDRQFIIEEEFQPYVDLFFKEAEARGVELDGSDLEVLFVDQIAGGFCGFGYWDYGTRGNSRVEISRTSGCWTDRTPLEKENFMFHELGHALLSRPHLITRFRNGYPASLMCSSETERGILGCNNFQTYYQTEEMRDYYLDELFFGLSNVEEPSWTQRNQFVRSVFSDSIGSDISDWENVGTSGEAAQFLETSGAFGTSKKLGLAITANSEIEVISMWLQRFEISDFEDCSSLKARAKVRVNQPLEGTVQMGLSLRQTVENDLLHRFMFHRLQEDRELNINNAEWMELEVYCVPQYAEFATISFMLIGESPDTVFIDDVEIELWE